MISVAARTAYPAVTPAPRARIQGFVDPLRAEGIDLRYLPGLTDDEYGAIAAPGSAAAKARLIVRAAMRERRLEADADLSLVHRLLFVAPVPGFDPPEDLDLYDFDDALQLGSISASNRFAAPLKREAERWRSYVRSARLVIAGNDNLADAARRERGDRPIEVVPTCVDPGRYELRRHGAVETLTLGWIGSSSTAPYLEAVLPAIGRVVDAGVVVRLVVIGAEVGADLPWVECRPWKLASEVGDIASFDVGLMPLPDDEWSRGKCGYKLLQYFAAGVPAIASPVGVASSMVGIERGVLASGDEEWAAAITSLAGDPEARAQMGAGAREFVEAGYSYSRWAPELAAMIAGLA